MTGAQNDFSALIHQAYDAAVGTTNWEDVLGSVCALCGGSNSSIDVVDIGKGSVLAQFNHGIDPHYADLFAQEYVNNNPLTSSILSLDSGQLTGGRQLISSSVLEQTEFYNDWCVPQGSIDNCISLLAKQGTLYSIMQVTYPVSAGHFDRDKARLVDLISPHISRAIDLSVRVSKDLALARADEGWATPADLGVAVVSRDRKILRLNRRFETIAARYPDQISLSDGQLSLRNQHAGCSLEAVAGAGDHTGLAAYGLPSVAYAPVGDANFLEIDVVPVSSENPFFQLSNHAPAALVSIRDRGEAALRGAKKMANAHQLTEAEEKILIEVLNAKSRAETAQRLGLTEHTVKTHLSRVFEKTRTSRQAELVMLANQFKN